MCSAITADCCESELFSFINLSCSAGIGVCQRSGIYYCSGVLPSSNVLCSAVSNDNKATIESCNGLDDDCDGEIDEDFGVGEECHTDERIGEYECEDESRVYCKILATNTPTNTLTNTPEIVETLEDTPTYTQTNTLTNTPSNTFTNTYTYTNTPTPTVTFTNTTTFTTTPTITLTSTFTPYIVPTIEVITPRTELPSPGVKKEENNKILVINLPKINYGALKENQGIAKAKIRYVIHIRKVKRLGVKDKYYKLGKKILTYKRKNKYNIKQMDMGIYSVRYQVVIIGKNQTKYTKWSKKKLIEI